MKRVLSLVLAAALTLSLAALVYSADDAKKGTTASKGSARYLVLWAHTPEECLAALDDIAAGGPKALGAWDFGCEAGDHTAYRMLMAKDDQAAMAMVPASGKEKAKLIKLNKFTAAQVKAFHEKMAEQQPESEGQPK